TQSVGTILSTRVIDQAPPTTAAYAVRNSAPTGFAFDWQALADLALVRSEAHNGGRGFEGGMKIC
ncbi:hypothetical protein, partial [Pseudomonas sp. FW305-47B]